jgi:hypothetical protein
MFRTLHTLNSELLEKCLIALVSFCRETTISTKKIRLGNSLGRRAQNRISNRSPRRASEEAARSNETGIGLLEVGLPRLGGLVRLGKLHATCAVKLVYFAASAKTS